MSFFRLASTARPLKVAVPALVVFAVTACTNPAGLDLADEGGEGTGMLSLSARSSGVGAQTVFPEIEQELIDYYHVVLEDGPAGTTERTVEATENGEFPEDVVIEDVVPGTWHSLEITAYDGDPDDKDSLAVLRGTTKDITVTAGELEDVNVQLEFIDDGGEGSVEFEVSWPVDSDVEKLSYSISSYGEEDTDIQKDVEDFDNVEDDDRESYTIKEDELPVGVYISTVRLDIAADGEDDDAIDTSVWVMDEIVYVSENVTTRTEIAVDDETLTEVFQDDFSDAIDDSGDQDDWDESEDDDGDFFYTGQGGTELEFDAFDENVRLKFRVRNENHDDGGKFDRDNEVTVQESGDGDDEIIQTDVPYPYGDSTRAEDDDFLGAPYLGAREGDDTDEKGDEYPEELDNNKGFMQFEVDIDAGVDFEIKFAGGGRVYSVGFFEVEER